jgi:hypothetical protein
MDAFSKAEGVQRKGGCYGNIQQNAVIFLLTMTPVANNKSLGIHLPSYKGVDHV